MTTKHPQPVSATVAGVPAVVEPAAFLVTRNYGNGGFTEWLFKLESDAKQHAQYGDVITPLFAAPFPTASPLPQADMPRDATEGVMANDLCGHDWLIVESGYRFDQKCALCGLIKSAGSTVASAGEQDVANERAILILQGIIPNVTELQAVGLRIVMEALRASPAAPVIPGNWKCECGYPHVIQTAAPVIAPGEAVAWQFRQMRGDGQPASRWTECDKYSFDNQNPGNEYRDLYLSPPPKTGSDGQDAKDAARWRHARRWEYLDDLDEEEIDAAMAQLTARPTGETK